MKDCPENLGILHTLASMPKQKSQPTAPPICKPIQCLWLDMEVDLLLCPTAKYSFQLYATRKHDQRILATSESILQLHLGRELRWQTYPAVLSQWHTPATKLRAQTDASANQTLVASPTFPRTLPADISRNLTELTEELSLPK